MMKRLISLVLCAVVLCSMFTLSSTASAADTDRLPFTDVKTSKWYYKDIRTVYEAGVMEGMTKTKFAPDDPMTRAQIVTVFYRLADRWETGLGKKLGFTDTKASA